MNNITVVINNKDSIDSILSKDISSVIIGVRDLSIYDFTLDIEDIIDISNKTDKKVIVAINKMLHCSNIDIVRDILLKIKSSKIYGILFYDPAIIKLSKELDLDKELIISQEHLNRSISSHMFYKKRGINSSFISSDITIEEIKNIKNNTGMNIYYTVFGRVPIFYSRRMLLTNYFKYIDKEKNDNSYYIFNNDLKYLVNEKDFGTIIYSDVINLINEINDLNDINMVIDLSYFDDISIIDKFINREVMSDTYKGFYEVRSIYKLRGDNNER